MKKFFLPILVLLIFIKSAHAFTNSLDNQIPPEQNPLSAPTKQQQPNNPMNSTFNPKTHDSLNHQENQFPNSSINPSRYNTSCQFGICIPGGINPNSR